MCLESLRGKRIQEKERERMVKVLRDEEIETGVNTLRQAGSDGIQMRCSSCGLEWESGHDEETCPLKELEAAFLSEDWFLMSSEATSGSRQRPWK